VRTSTALLIPTALLALAIVSANGCSSPSYWEPQISSNNGAADSGGGSGGSSGGGSGSSSSGASGTSSGSGGGSGTSSGSSSGSSSGGSSGSSSGGSSGSSSGAGTGSSSGTGGSGSSSSGSGSGGGNPYGSGSPGARSIPPDVLARKGICYSGYRANESPKTNPPTYPTEAEVTQDLQILAQGNWTFMRLFDCGPQASVVWQAIRDGNFDMKVMQGVRIAGPASSMDSENQAEIQRCMALNSMYGDSIVAWSVGNETLDYWSSILTPVADLANYIQQVRNQVEQPVTTDDMWPVFALLSGSSYSYANVTQVVQQIDFIAVHSYPFLDAPYSSWDYQQTSVAEGPQRASAMMAAAQAYNVGNVAVVHQNLQPMGLDRPVLLGETGWKSVPYPNSYEVSLAHPVNQQMYYDTIESWVYGATKDSSSPLTAFYFAFSDEPWKAPDDNWGLFDTNRNAKYVMYSEFPNLKAPNAPSYTSADAVYYKSGNPTNPRP
jgi:exo-beta-1,3-glucanase (GH17 family)